MTIRAVLVLRDLALIAALGLITFRPPTRARLPDDLAPAAAA